MRKLTTIAALAVSLLILPAAQQAMAQSSDPAPRVIAADDQPTKEQLAKLFEVMRLRQQMDTMMKSMSAIMQQQVTQQIKSTTGSLPSGATVSPEQQQRIDNMMHKYMDRAMNLYPVSEMIDDMAVIYQKHLSREDVDAFIAFYASPAGQHLLDEQPAIMKEYLPIVSQRMQERTKTLTDEMTKDIEQLAKPQDQQK